MEYTYTIDYIKDFLNHYNYPEEARNLFINTLKKIDQRPLYRFLLHKSINAFMRTQHFSKDVLSYVNLLAALMKESKYTLQFCLLLSLLEFAKKKYDDEGIDETLFYETFTDLFYKCRECREYKGVYGTFVTSWFAYFYFLKRFTYGRFQFEIKKYPFPLPFTFSSGRKLCPGDTYINVHIPSSGVPLTDEIRYDSYLTAWKQYHQLFGDDIVIFGCESWLLYPDNRKILPEGMNILKFMDDYEIGKVINSPVFIDKWRIFGKSADGKTENLYENTKLQKAFKTWLLNGGKTGLAFGWMEFSPDEKDKNA